MMNSYHGDLRAQFMKMAAMASRVTSVMNALPLVKNMPPTAGRSASTRGAECQWLLSSSSCWSSCPLARGRKMSSVEDRKDLLVSDKVSEIKELWRRFNGV